MNARLTLLIPERWPQSPECEWVLTDLHGRLLQRGCSIPRHWPAAGEHVAILDGAQASLLAVDLPPSKRKDRPTLLAFALEAQLARDIEHEHVTVIADTAAGRGEDGTRCVAVVVIAAARLQQVCAQFDALERPLSRAVSLLQCLDASPQHWQLACIDGTSAALRVDTGRGLCLDLPSPEGDPDSVRSDNLHAMLDLALRDPALEGQRPERLEIALVPPLTEAEHTRLTQDIGLDVLALESGHVWHRSLQATSLLHGPFAPRTGQDNGIAAALRRPSRVAGAALAVTALLMGVDLILDRAELARLEERQQRIFAEALPGTPPVAPERQVQRALRDARHAHGELAEGDLLSLLAAVTSLTGQLPETFNYREQGLELVLPEPPTTVAPLVRQGLQVAVEGRRLTLSWQP